MKLASIGKISVAAANGAANKAKGAALEDRVARILEAEGHRAIQQNVLLTDRNGNKSEIDVRYGRWLPRYVECKAYGTDHSVPLEDVAKFREVLRLHGVPLRRALFVTTSTYSPRAKTTGIKTIDGTQLVAWEGRAMARLRFRRRVHMIGSGLGTCIVVLGLAVWVAGTLPAPGQGTLGRRHSPIEEGSIVALLQEFNMEIAEGWRRGRSAAPIVFHLPVSLGVPAEWARPRWPPSAPSAGSGASWDDSLAAGPQRWWSRLQSSLGLSPPDPSHQPVRRAAYEVGRLATTAEDAGRRAMAWGEDQARRWTGR